MHLLNLGWHSYLVLISFAACITGLFLTHDGKADTDEKAQTELALFNMCFSYWIVYCIVFAIQKISLPDWEILQLSLKLTAAFSYFLTSACVLCLPLSRLAVRQIQE